MTFYLLINNNESLVTAITNLNLKMICNGSGCDCWETTQSLGATAISLLDSCTIMLLSYYFLYFIFVFAMAFPNPRTELIRQLAPSFAKLMRVHTSHAPSSNSIPCSKQRRSSTNNGKQPSVSVTITMSCPHRCDSVF